MINMFIKLIQLLKEFKEVFADYQDFMKETEFLSSCTYKSREILIKLSQILNSVANSLFVIAANC